MDGGRASMSGNFLCWIEPDAQELARLAGREQHESHRSTLTIIVPPAPLPVDGSRKDGAVRSCIASGPWLSSFKERGEDEDLCYRLLHYALSGEVDIPDIQIVNGVEPQAGPSATSVEFVIPHRGAPQHLDVCLVGVKAQTLECKASLCLDEVSEWSAGAVDASRVRLFQAVEPPIGPYAIRQLLAMQSDADYIAFQDSDDFSLPSRVSELVSAAESTGADIVGCHELRLDELEREVLAIRFPMDVNAALSMTARHAQFFPTTLARRTTLLRNGGFSTIRKFGGDTEYLLRSHFSARIINIDRFLYIRRRRPGSLTTTPETALGSPIRKQLREMWLRDFELIKSGALGLHESSLALRHGPPTSILPVS